jgi:hypothetical protein
MSTFNDNITFKERIMIKTRTYYSISHVLGAAQLARLAENIERTYDGKWSDELFHEHRAYVTGSILLSVSFLEATINEVFADADDNSNTVKHLNPEVRVLMANMWRLGVHRSAAFSILNKFKLALVLAGKPLMDSGPPYEQVLHLIKLRNALVHYEPEWITNISEIDSEEVTVSKFEERLMGKFPLNPLVGEENPFFPDRCLGYGCAKWALTNSVRFADEFFSRMGLSPTYGHVRSRLKTE